MKTRLFTILAIIMALGTAQLAKAALVDSNSIIENNIEYYIQTDKSVYNLGESVEILYRVTNLGEDTVILGVSKRSPYCYEFVITDEDNDHVWKWPWGVPIDSGNFSLGPYESREYQFAWNMINDNGTPGNGDDYTVSPGTYEISGGLFITPPKPNLSVFIQIIPEPATIALLGAGCLILRQNFSSSQGSFRV